MAMAEVDQCKAKW